MLNRHVDSRHYIQTSGNTRPQFFLKNELGVPAETTMDDFLERCALLEGVTSQGLLRHGPTATICAFRHEDTIYRQGTRCNYLFIINSSLVKLARINRDGRELTTAFMVSGDLFGPDLGSPSMSKSQETATAKGAISAWRVPAQEFRNLLLNHPTVGLRILEMLARRQRQMERRRVECFAFKRTEARLAETLREPSKGFEPRCEHGFGTHIRLPNKFDSKANAENYLQSALFQKDVVAALRPCLAADPEVRIYERA